MKNAVKKIKGFSEFEREAIRNRAKELAAEAKSNKNKAQGESDVFEAIAASLPTGRQAVS